MHLKDDQLRAYSDQELPSGLSRQIGEHLKRCPQCQQRLDHLQSIQQQVHAHIDSLSPTPLERPRPAREAYARMALNRQITQPMKARENPMVRRKSFWAALAVITALVLVFTITPARAWAGTFLNMFRVQQVQVVTFDPAAVEGLEDQMEANQAAFKQLFEDDLEISGREEAQTVGSVEEAAQLAGFSPRVPAALADAKISVQPGMSATLIIDQPKLQELANLVGVDLTLPETLDGQPVNVSVPSVIVFSNGCDDGDPADPDTNCLAVMQLPSPTVDAPDELDLPRMGEALFQVLGYTADEARQLSQSIDWTSTLVLPLPTDPDVSHSQVTVDGVSGTLLLEGRQAMLIWVKDGMLYTVTAPGGADEAMTVAQSLQ